LPPDWGTTNRIGKYCSGEGSGVALHGDIDAWIRMKPQNDSLLIE